MHIDNPPSGATHQNQGKTLVPGDTVEDLQALREELRGDFKVLRDEIHKTNRTLASHMHGDARNLARMQAGSVANKSVFDRFVSVAALIVSAGRLVTLLWKHFK